jgi:protein-S-isoprenylcysteine O-methyltransferase Ste14
MATTVWLVCSIFAQVMVIFYPGVLVFWLIVHSNIERLRAWGTRAYWVAAVAWLTTAGPLLVFRSRIFSVRWLIPQPFATIVTILGIVTLTLASVCLSQARRQISFRTMIGLPEIEPHQNKQPVLSSGIYARTRNPIYLAHLLLVFSSAALTGFAANWIGFAVDCFILPLLIHTEESELLARYGGEFAEYMRRVPRLFPQLR